VEQPLLRLLIQEKLADGRLPHDHFPRVRSGPGSGERCDGCGETVTAGQTVMGNLDAAACGLRLHVACFHVWDVERQASGREPSVRLPARSAFRQPGARPNRPWAPRAPAARPGGSASP
jgi:hypothetical protein